MRITTAAIAIVLSAVSLMAGEDAAKTHTVTIEAMRFQPETLTVSRGDTIVWVNKDVVAHTATSEDGRFDSKTIETDASWKYIARERGDFAYICDLHPEMKATLRVR